MNRRAGGAPRNETMRYLWLVPLSYAALVIDTTWSDAARIGPVAPDVPLLAALAWALFDRDERAFLAAGAVMLAADLASPGRAGVGAGAMLVVAFALAALRRGFGHERLAARWALLVAAALAWTLAVGLAARCLGDVELDWSEVAWRAVGTALLTAAAALPVLMLLGWWGESARRCRAPDGV